MPRMLTENEKDILKGRIKKEAKRLITQFGIKNLTIDQITRSSSISKGAFYLYYQSKEELLFDLIVEIHEIIFNDAFNFFKAHKDQKLEDIIPKFIYHMFQSNEHMILFKNSNEIMDIVRLYFQSQKTQYVDLEHYEVESYRRILHFMNIDDHIVLPEIVSNIIHTIYLSSSYLTEIGAKNIDQTISVIISGLVSYIQKGVKK